MEVPVLYHMFGHILARGYFAILLDKHQYVSKIWPYFAGDIP